MKHQLEKLPASFTELFDSTKKVTQELFYEVVCSLKNNEVIIGINNSYLWKRIYIICSLDDWIEFFELDKEKDPQIISSLDGSPMAHGFTQGRDMYSKTLGKAIVKDFDMRLIEYPVEYSCVMCDERFSAIPARIVCPYCGTEAV